MAVGKPLNSIESALERLYKNDANHPAFDGGEVSTTQLALVREAVARTCWGFMNYRCKDCGWETQIFLGLGVEGPPNFKLGKVYIPSPFMIRCAACHDGQMSHINWKSDGEFDTVLIPNDDVAYFRLPATMLRGDEGAELVQPSEYIVKARRWYHEEGPGPRLT